MNHSRTTAFTTFFNLFNRVCTQFTNVLMYTGDMNRAARIISEHNLPLTVKKVSDGFAVEYKQGEETV